MTIIEVIPNISEGVRTEVIAACVNAVTQAGASLLDVSSDPAHHRTVLTLAGNRQRTLTAVLALFDRAIDRIDLREHRGVHPRLGAVDVVPFVPLGSTSMLECVELARAIAAQVAARHALPIYLYEEAAVVPGRRRLEVIRRGGFEALAARMQDPEWAPDFGPARPHPSAGASIIGARWPLIAYNVNLGTDRIDIAKAIAADVRESSGGLPCVKALGVPLRHRHAVQVTMNLTNFRTTSMLAAFERVRAAAERAGVRVLESEIVGLVPEAALPPNPQETLLLAGFGSQVLEDRLRAAGLGV
ncbi:MAG: glutamate formimidoyltransferase [Vicinamibacterales bacterium]